MEKLFSGGETLIGEHSSLTTRVYERLEGDIIAGKYAPGDSMVETRISESLGVSRTPIREAMRQLEHAGLVKLVPNKGAVVLGISTQDIHDIYTIRSRVEGLASRWAAERISADELEKLREYVELSEFYAKRGEAENLLALDSGFHEQIYAACKSNPMRDMLSSFHHTVRRARALSFMAPGRALTAVEEHKAIFAAIEERNGDMAEKLTLTHIENACENLFANSARL